MLLRDQHLFPHNSFYTAMRQTGVQPAHYMANLGLHGTGLQNRSSTLIYVEEHKQLYLNTWMRIT